MLRPIVKYGTASLQTPALPVSAFDAALNTLIDDMIETMYAAPGIGLAAPQVGVARRVIVVDVARTGHEPQPLRMANPEIVWASDQEASYEEGCLSLPEHYADVVRPEEVRVRYLDHENKIREVEAKGVLATCIQHEMDHLDGVLFVDHISALKRGIILRKLTKSKKSKTPAAPATAAVTGTAF